MTALPEIGRRLWAADDAAHDVMTDTRLTPDKASLEARAIILRAETRAAQELAAYDVWDAEAATLRAQAVALDSMALEWPEHAAALSEAAGELRNVAASVRAVLTAIREAGTWARSIQPGAAA